MKKPPELSLRRHEVAYARLAFVERCLAIGVHHQVDRVNAVLPVVVRLATVRDDAVVGRSEMPTPLIVGVPKDVEGHDEVRY